jgi:hypothetical protein
MPTKKAEDLKTISFRRFSQGKDNHETHEPHETKSEFPCRTRFACMDFAKTSGISTKLKRDPQAEIPFLPFVCFVCFVVVIRPDYLKSVGYCLTAPERRSGLDNAFVTH